MERAENRLRDPDKLGKYRIVGILGEGAMGVVYHGIDEGLGRKVAIKTVRPGLLKGKAGRQLLERFQREAQAEGRLNHPNIVAIYEFQGGEEEMPFFVMEYVDGKSLKEYLSRGMHFNLDMSLRIVVQLLSALSHSHSQGIIHRDIKPANILLLEDDSVKIADFGVARIEDSEYTQTGQVIGTPQYFSPEQSQGKKIDARSDLYSAALVFYELLTGEKLFSRQVNVANNHRVTEELLAKLDIYPPDSQRVLKVTLIRALAKEPEKRFQSAADFSTALQPLMVKKEKPVKRGSKWLITSTAVLGVVLLAAAYFVSRQEILWSDIWSNMRNAPVSKAVPTELSAPEQERLNHLLRVGEIHLMVGRLILPDGSNAYHAYQMALAIAPGNSAAQAGMAKVQDRLLQQLRQLVAEGDIDSAREQTSLAQRLFPDNRQLRALREEIAE
jgi:serine/threonine-protein kinase